MTTTTWAGARVSRRRVLRAALGATAVALGAGMLDTARGGLAATTGRAAPFGSIDGLDADGSVVMRWGAATLDAVRATHPAPTVVARALAIVHTCMYDAWAAYHPVAAATRPDGATRRPAAERTEENKGAAVSYAAHRALVDLFPSRQAPFDALLAGLGYDPTATALDTGTPGGVGRVAAQAVIAYRHGDGANQLGDLHPGAYSDYTGYRPAVSPYYIAPRHTIDPNRWQPLHVPDGQGGVAVQQFVTPQWGRVAPFALASGAQFRPATGPARYPDPRYLQQAVDLLHLSATLTDRQKAIAEYWADGPSSELPPGHWCLFAHYASLRDGHDLDRDVVMMFALANALLDASIACWDAKRAYDSERPVTAIHYLFSGRQVIAWGGPYRGSCFIDGGDWQPYQPLTVVTPAFPEFVSGHSTFSAAGAEILARVTGSDRCGASFTCRAGDSKVEPGATPATDMVLSWPTFTAAADEAGLSRRYGGIHFEDGDLVGRAMGRRVAAVVWDKAQRLLAGYA